MREYSHMLSLGTKLHRNIVNLDWVGELGKVYFGAVLIIDEYKELGLAGDKFDTVFPAVSLGHSNK